MWKGRCLLCGIGWPDIENPGQCANHLTEAHDVHDYNEITLLSADRLLEPVIAPTMLWVYRGEIVLWAQKA